MGLFTNLKSSNRLENEGQEGMFRNFDSICLSNIYNRATQKDCYLTQTAGASDPLSQHFGSKTGFWEGI